MSVDACLDEWLPSANHAKNLGGEGFFVNRLALDIDVETEGTFGTGKWNFGVASPSFSATNSYTYNDSSWLRACVHHAKMSILRIDVPKVSFDFHNCVLYLLSVTCVCSRC